ncbi:MAG: chemotaxis protein CheW [Deltaproteobacteria bacterium]|uniref:Chemotaxis protein CheA n=1 Tax=Candidatus Zymogenus saltonus TaxID=2844893 RepID=A0A9D8KE50_9DELT|nr:chemotaxis protein CheW [Candidatus Zymogenus saltonus]
MIDEELLKEFIIEGNEHLSDFEVNLNRLIDEPENREVLNQVFRAVHSIKGSADYLGLSKTGGFLHSLEGILEKLRGGDMRLTKEVLDVLFLGMDTVRSILKDLSQSGEEMTDISAIQARVESVLEGVGEDDEVLELDEVNDKDVDIYEGLEELDEAFKEYEEKEEGEDIYEGLEDVDGIFEREKREKEELDIYEGLEDVDDIFAREKEKGEEVDIYDGLEDIDFEGESGVAGERFDEKESTQTDFFDDEIEVVLEEHLTELERSVKKLEDTKTLDELDNFLKLVNSFSTSIEYFGFDELNTILSGIIRTVQLMLDEGERVSDTEVLYFYNALDQIRGFVKGEGFSEVIEPKKSKTSEIFSRVLTLEEAVREFTIIPGVGGSKAKDIYEAGIKSLKALSEIRVEELEAIKGINLNLARNIRAYFRERGDVVKEEPKPARVEPRPAKEEPKPARVEPKPFKTEPPKPGVSDDVSLKLREEVKEDFKEGYDVELVDIFLTATVDLFSLLEIDLGSIRKMEADENTLREIIDVTWKLKRSAKYMEYENISKRLDEVNRLTTKYLDNRDEFTVDDVSLLVKGLLELREGLRKSKIISGGEEAGDVDYEELSEEDKELVQIFLSAADQYIDTLSTCLTNFREGKNIEETVEIYQKALESLKSSAKFMGYDNIIDNLDNQLGLIDKNVIEDKSGSQLYGDLVVSFNKLKEEVEEVSDIIKEISTEKMEIKTLYLKKEPAARLEDVEVKRKDVIEKLPPKPEPVVRREPAAAPLDRRAVPTGQPGAQPTGPSGAQPTGPPGGATPPDGTGGMMPPGDEGEPPGTDFAYSKQTLRVETDRVDNIMNLVGELVVNRASFSQLLLTFKEAYRDILELKKLDKSEIALLRQLSLNMESSTMELGRVANELQEGVMRVRMVGINQLFSRFPRLVRDLADKMDKRVKLAITGRETELDKSVIEEIGDPLIHIIRNAIDHGIESVAERRKNGKPEMGTLAISAYHQGNQVIIEVTDDGSGIDQEAIKDRMVVNGEITEAERIRVSEREALNYLFKPGISMAKRISNVSGRGVGLDIVKKNIDKLNGTVDVVTEMNVGTKFLIKLPLTLAIIQALIVDISGKNYSIPLSAVTETVRVNLGEIDTIEGHQVLRIRDKVLPLLSLKDVFKMNYDLEGEGFVGEKQVFVVVLSAEGREVGLIVDRLVGEENIVIKSLEEYLSDTKGVSGASIMGDGKISLILDVIELVNLAIDKEKSIRRRQMQERLKRRNSSRRGNDTTSPA